MKVRLWIVEDHRSPLVAAQSAEHRRQVFMRNVCEGEQSAKGY